jgi:pimeloyl-ACP methyl ester carboxylesterase
MYVAEGAGPHPTVLYLHGFPGGPQPERAAVQVLRDGGLNVLFVNYRGAWRSEGTFSIEGTVRDAAEAVAFLRAPETQAAYRVDASRLALLGASFGGWVALNAAAADPAIDCVATVTLFNLGALGRELQASEALRAGWVQSLGQLLGGEGAPVQAGAGQGAEAFVRGIMAQADALDPVRLAPALQRTAVLLLSADGDRTAPPATHTDPLHAALTASAAASRASRRSFPGDHDLPLATFAPAVVEWVQSDCAP